MVNRKYIPAVVSIASLSIALLLVSMGLTGYAISNVGELDFRNFSIFFFFFGLVFAFVYLKRNKNLKNKI